MPKFRTLLRAAFALGFLLIAAASRAEQPPMVFQHLSAADGLSQSTVTVIFQDSQGFLWLGTQNGLNRYDGNEIKRYHRERNRPGGLANDFIRAIDEDKDGNLWLATDGGGLVKWDRRTDTFSSYRHSPEDPASLGSDSIRNVLVDRAGNVWATTRGRGLNRLDPATGEITHFFHSSDMPGSLSSNEQLQALLESEDGSIWVGTGAGVDRYDAQNNRFEHFTPPHSVGGIHNLSSLIEDHRGFIWMSSFDAGLHRLDPASGQFTHYSHARNDPTSLGDNAVSVVFEDSAQRLWAGHDSGLSLFDRNTGMFQTYTRDSARASSLAENTVRSLFEDRNGLLWVGYDNNGASRWNSRSWALGHRIPDWLPEPSMINAFADAGAGNLWMGTSAGVFLHEKNGRVTKMAESQALGDAIVMSLLRDRNDQLWIGTFSSGLFLRSADGGVRRFTANSGTEQGLGADGIMALYEDSTGRIWIGTFEGGITVYDPKTGQLRRYLDLNGETPWLGKVRAGIIREDNLGRMWIGTYGDGLLVIAPDEGLLHQFSHDPNQPGTLSSNTVYGLHVGTDDDLWIGTGGSGLDYVADINRGFQDLYFENMSQADGLSNDVIYGIVADRSGQLWLPSNNGLMRLDPATRSVRTYHSSHGAQSEEYTFGAAFLSASGRLLFAGTHGYNDFDPLQLSETSLPPPVVITGIEVLYEPLDSAVAVPMVEAVELDYHENVLSLEFAALDFTDPSRNKFAYRLVGFDEDWIELRNEHRVSYTNLSQGNYEFQVKAAGADLVWNEAGAKLAITMRPAPWRTWWAYAIYAALAALLALAIYRSQTRRLREQQRYARLLAEEVKARTAELKQRNSELADASAAKSNFLARMSHEIRTPMNGVIGMAELLSATDLKPQQQRYAETITRSAGTLLQIINDILDLSKIEAQRVELETKPFELRQLIDDCVDLIATQAKKKGIRLSTEIDTDIPRGVAGDRLRIYQVLTNLLSNALKFTAEGEIILRAELRELSDERAVVRIEVSDTGIGIEEDALERVFDAFSQADETTTRRFGGTGLGLSICKQLVELMNGRIGVSSQPNVGSTFWCEIPLAVAPAAAATNPVPADASPAGVTAKTSSRLTAKRVLVVEDNAVNRMVAEGTLARLGHDVGIATDGHAALEMLSTEEFDLVLMDCQMPGIDGFEATRRIRAAEQESGRHLPIVGLTAHASAGVREACLEAGMDDFVSKPFTIEDIDQMLRRYLT